LLNRGESLKPGLTYSELVTVGVALKKDKRRAGRAGEPGQGVLDNII